MSKVNLLGSRLSDQILIHNDDDGTTRYCNGKALGQTTSPGPVLSGAVDIILCSDDSVVAAYFEGHIIKYRFGVAEPCWVATGVDEVIALSLLDGDTLIATTASFEAIELDLESGSILSRMKGVYHACADPTAPRLVLHRQVGSRHNDVFELNFRHSLSRTGPGTSISVGSDALHAHAFGTSRFAYSCTHSGEMVVLNETGGRLWNYVPPDGKLVSLAGLPPELDRWIQYLSFAPDSSWLFACVRDKIDGNTCDGIVFDAESGKIMKQQSLGMFVPHTTAMRGNAAVGRDKIIYLPDLSIDTFQYH